MKKRTLLLSIVAAIVVVTGLIAAELAANKSSKEAVAAKNPSAVVTEKIRSEVGRQLRDGGAAFEDLQVAVAVDRDSATPFKVTYRGLKNFKAAEGQTAEADGSFVMEYAGSGKWQGKLAGVQFVVPVGTTDNIDLPFVNDPAVIGEWKSVDFVADPRVFNPERKSFRGQLYLTELVFLADGKTPKSWFTWTKGFLMHRGDKTASKYELREIQGQTFLFLEWKSGDVTISGMKPHYYVLQKKER